MLKTLILCLIFLFFKYDLRLEAFLVVRLNFEELLISSNSGCLFTLKVHLRNMVSEYTIPVLYLHLIQYNPNMKFSR